MKIGFVWAYRKFKVAHWLQKEDSMQYCIRRFSKSHEVSVSVLCDELCEPLRHDGATYIFFQEETHLLAHLKGGRFDFLFLNGPLAFDAVVARELPGVPKSHYCHYDPLSGVDVESLRLMDVVFVHQDYQRRFLECQGVANAIVAPHTPDLNLFRPMDVPRDYLSVSHARRDAPTKRYALAQAAYALISHPTRILDGNDAIPGRDMPAFLNSTNYYFHPSSSEAGGRIILEAMACNVPVVVCEDCLSACVYVNRFGGLIVSPEPQAIADTLNQLAESPVEVNSRKKMLEQDFGYEHMFRCMTAGFEKAISKRK